MFLPPVRFLMVARTFHGSLRLGCISSAFNYPIRGLGLNNADIRWCACFARNRDHEFVEMLERKKNSSLTKIVSFLLALF